MKVVKGNDTLEKVENLRVPTRMNQKDTYAK